MKLIVTSAGAVTVMFLSACSAESPGDSSDAVSLLSFLAGVIDFLINNVGATLAALASGAIGLFAGLVTTGVQNQHSWRSSELRKRLDFYAELTGAVMETENRFAEVERKAFSNYVEVEDNDYSPVEARLFGDQIWDFSNPDSASAVARRVDIDFQKVALKCHQLGSGIVMSALQIYVSRYNYFLHALENDKLWSEVFALREEMDSARQLLIDIIINDTRDMRMVAIRGLPRRIRKADREHFEELGSAVRQSLEERLEELARIESEREDDEELEPAPESGLSRWRRLREWLMLFPYVIR